MELFCGLGRKNAVVGVVVAIRLLISRNQATMPSQIAVTRGQNALRTGIEERVAHVYF